ncbi:MAG TPA: phosphopantetheine-binding protein [Chitinolyticbacter sp.]|nr:phosphopantetheine-binding protein [Chitinolyticbacter sp.]
MNNPYQEADLIKIVQKTLVGVLGCDEADVGPDVALGNDLDADSLDFVELRYSLEKQLGIVLPQKSVLDHLGEVAGDGEVYEQGRLSELAAFALQHSFFKYTPVQVKQGMLPYDVMGVATVANWARLCRGILDTLPQQCPDCAHDRALVSPVGKPVCAGCGTQVKPRTGDAAMAAAMPGVLAVWQQQTVTA